MEDGDGARRGPRARPSVLNPRRPTSTMGPGAGGLLGLRAMTESVRVPELAAGRGRSTDCDLLMDPDAVDRLDRALEAAGWEPVTSFAAGSVLGHEAGQGDAEGHAQHGPDRVGGDVHHGGVATGQGELIGLDRHGDPGPEQHPPPARVQHRECGEDGHEQQHVRQVGEHLRGDHRLQAQRPHRQLPGTQVRVVHGPAVGRQQQHAGTQRVQQQHRTGRPSQGPSPADGSRVGGPVRHGDASRTQYAPREASTARTVRARISRSRVKDQLST